MDTQYLFEKKFYDSTSNLIWTLTTCNFVSGSEAITEEPKSAFSKLKGHIVKKDPLKAQKQLDKSRVDVISAIRQFMGMFPNFTYKAKAVNDPDVVHSIVKFREAFETVSHTKADPELIRLYNKLDKKLDDFIGLAPKTLPPIMEAQAEIAPKLEM